MGGCNLVISYRVVSLKKWLLRVGKVAISGDFKNCGLLVLSSLVGLKVYNRYIVGVFGCYNPHVQMSQKGGVLFISGYKK